jgi:4-hydroxy-2-oxoglutarate aldolase
LSRVIKVLKKEGEATMKGVRTGGEATMKLKGVLPPIATPFKNENVAYDTLKENFAKWNKTGVAGYLVLGSNGEGNYLSEKERLKMVEVSRDSIPKSKVMLVGTGQESTRETIRFTNEAAKLGADYALVLTPCYYKGAMKPPILHDHFVAVAEASRIPVLLYNVPQYTGINMEPDLVAKLSRHPNIVGIKDSSGNISQLSQIIHTSQKNFRVFTGSGLVLFPALCVGAVGGVLAVANALPRESVRIYTLFTQGKMDQARELQNRMAPFATAVTAKHSIGGLKMAMDLAGYFGGLPRLPLKKPGPEVEAELKGLMHPIVSF